MNSFSKRHIGINKSDKAKMLDYLNVRNIDELISETVPENIRLQKEMKLKKPLSENEYLSHIERLGKKNKVFKSYIGCLLYTSPSPRDRTRSRMPSSA